MVTSLYAVTDSLYLVPSPLSAVLIQFYAVANSLYAVLLFRSLHGASLSLDLRYQRTPNLIIFQKNDFRFFR